MRYIILACALLGASCHAADVVRLSQPVAQSATHEVFGTPMPSMETVQSLEQLVADAERYLDQDVVLKTRIAKVCQKKGCFFVATDGATTARVTFKDYEFSIPTDAGGKTVALAGRFGRKALSTEQAAHYARDLGEEPSADTAQFEYVIVATSISIPKGD